jgi:hypothetical protein
MFHSSRFPGLILYASLTSILLPIRQLLVTFNRTLSMRSLHLLQQNVPSDMAACFRQLEVLQAA